MLILFPPIEGPDNSKSLLAFSLVTFHIQTWSPEWPANDSIWKKTSLFLTQNVNYNPYIIQQQQRSLQYFGIFFVCLFVSSFFQTSLIDKPIIVIDINHRWISIENKRKKLRLRLISISDIDNGFLIDVYRWLTIIIGKDLSDYSIDFQHDAVLTVIIESFSRDIMQFFWLIKY